jgi:hypothetical protein
MNPRAPWRPRTEQPARLSATGLIAVLSEDGEPFLLGELYEWTADGWARESDGAPLTRGEFWWAAEGDLLAALPRLTAAAGGV